MAGRPLAVLIIALSVLSTAACGSGSGERAQPPASPRAAETPKERGCSFVAARDVSRLAGVDVVRRRNLAPDATVVCSTAFAGSYGALVAVVTELGGGPQELQRLRAAKVDELGASAVRALRSFGPGAFVANRRLLAFRREGRVLVVETGYDQRGKLVLSVGELVGLARVVAARL